MLKSNSNSNSKSNSNSNSNSNSTSSNKKNYTARLHNAFNRLTSESEFHLYDLPSFLKRFPAKDVTDEYGMTVLHHLVQSIEAGRYTSHVMAVVSMIDKLLSEGRVSVNARDLEGSTPLHYCVDPAYVEILCRHGAHVNAKNRMGETAYESSREQYIEGDDTFSLIKWTLLLNGLTLTKARGSDAIRRVLVRSSGDRSLAKAVVDLVYSTHRSLFTRPLVKKLWNAHPGVLGGIMRDLVERSILLRSDLRQPGVNSKASTAVRERIRELMRERIRERMRKMYMPIASTTRPARLLNPKTINMSSAHEAPVRRRQRAAFVRDAGRRHLQWKVRMKRALPAQTNAVANLFSTFQMK